jgi:hypothetical protein
MRWPGHPYLPGLEVGSPHKEILGGFGGGDLI